MSERSGNNDSSVVTGASVGDVKVYNRIKAATGTVRVKWVVNSYSQGSTAGTLKDGWGFNGLCDNEGCRDGAAVLMGTSFTSSPYSATPGYTNTENDFHAQFNADNAAPNSIAYIRASVADAANPTTTARTFTFLASKSAAGVTSVTRSDDNIIVYPNPATDVVNVIFDKNSKIRTIAVYNLIGQATDMYRVSGNSAKLELSEAPAGIYFLRMLDDRGSIVATRRFNRQ